MTDGASSSGDAITITVVGTPPVGTPNLYLWGVTLDGTININNSNSYVQLNDYSYYDETSRGWQDVIGRNNGTININNGADLAVDYNPGITWVNAGIININNGAKLDLKGNTNSSTASWTNTGTINVASSGTLDLGGAFSQGDPGTINNTGGRRSSCGMSSPRAAPTLLTSASGSARPRQWTPPVRPTRPCSITLAWMILSGLPHAERAGGRRGEGVHTHHAWHGCRTRSAVGHDLTGKPAGSVRGSVIACRLLLLPLSDSGYELSMPNTRRTMQHAFTEENAATRVDSSVPEEPDYVGGAGGALFAELRAHLRVRLPQINPQL